MRHRACLGERSVAYSLGTIEIMEGATVAQEAYLCTGTHDFSDAWDFFHASDGLAQFFRGAPRGLHFDVHDIDQGDVSEKINKGFT